MFPVSFHTAENCCSVAKSHLTFCDPINCSTPGFPVLHSLPEFAQTHVHWATMSSSVVPFSSCPQSIPASGSFPVSWLFASGSQSIGTSVSVLPMNIPMTIQSFWWLSIRIDWFGLLAVQGTLKSLLQYHSSKTPILWCSAFFMVQLSCVYMITGKPIALTWWTFVGKVMSLFSNTLSSWS